MTDLLVSIIIPCYNGEAYVAEAIQSALDQTWPRVEVIVIDDGSTDGSLEVIRSFGDQIRWEAGPNRGGCAARNRGSELANGEFVQFLDADDLLDADKLEWQLGLPAKDRHLVVCDRVDFNLESGEKREVRLPFDNDEPFRSVLRCERLGTSAPLHRRKWLLEVGGFDRSLPCAQEYDLHLRLAANGVRFIHHPRVAWTARIRDGSVSSSWGRVLQQHPAIFERLYDIVDSAWEESEKTRVLRWISEAAMRSARNAFGLENIAAGRHLLSFARQAHPSRGYGDFERRSERILARALGVERYCGLRKKWLG